MPQSDFSRRAQNYEAHAHIQYNHAEQLVQYSLKYIPANSKIADLGCGTGSISKVFKQHSRNAHIENYDSSKEMLKVAQENLKSDQNSFHLGSLPETSDYDLIISNFALQWFDDVFSTVQNCINRLKDGGVLSICIPVAGSFDSLKKSFEAVGAQDYFFSFPQSETILKAIGDNTILLNEITNEDEEFDSTLDFFKNIHGIGANQRGMRLGSSKLRKLIEYHDELFDGKIIVRYKILKLIAKRVIS